MVGSETPYLLVSNKENNYKGLVLNGFLMYMKFHPKVKFWRGYKASIIEQPI
jgi:hypothetical protein